MTVLVTGGTGFVGFNVVERLLADGREVLIFDSSPLPAQARQAIARHAARLAVVQGDVTDVEQVAHACKRHAVHRIVHCAAITSGSEREARDPHSIVKANLNGTINVLDAARRSDVRRVVYVSSGSVYGESLYQSERLFEERTPVLPIRLYSITKYAAERTCLRMREPWNVDAVCARLGNVIGPWERDTGARDRFDVHSQIAVLAATGKEAVLPSRVTRRDSIYSRDVAAGLIALLDADAPRHPVYNIATGTDWGNTLAMWCQSLKTVYPNFSYRVASAGEHPSIAFSDEDRAPMDVTRMVEEFGFQPRGPDAAYADYLDWIKSTPGFWQPRQHAPPPAITSP